VGDDWQSIYRFAGGDVALMRDFKAHFGRARTVTLDRTFRLNNRINECASKFIQCNPGQLRKTIDAARTETGPRVFLGVPAECSDVLLLQALSRIRMERPAATVMILGRYNHSKPLTLDSMRESFPSLEIEFRTVHRSKGLEADYVVVVDLGSGGLGFPCEQSDDAVLQLVLAREDEFEHAEERRLFYVALTRARHGVYLLADANTPSCFVTELRDGEYETEWFGDRPADVPKCRVCMKGELQQRDGPYGLFHGCSNYPYCDETYTTCSACGKGALLKEGTRFVCSEPDCDHSELACPQCQDGRRVRREGPYGPFWGCSQYPRCDYTMNIEGADR
jgi:DNA helicase-4